MYSTCVLLCGPQVKNTKKIYRKAGKRHEHILHKKIKMVLKHKRWFSLKIRKCKSELLRCHFSPVRQKLKSLTIHSIGKAMVKQRLASIAVGMQNSTAPVEENLAMQQNYICILTLGIYFNNNSSNMKILMHCNAAYLSLYNYLCVVMETGWMKCSVYI